MHNIEILYDSRNYTIIKDNMTKYVWLYSYQKPIAYFDTVELRIHFKNTEVWTQTNKFHFSNFKKFLGV